MGRRRRGGPLIAGVLALAVVSGCAGQAVPPPPPPAPSTSPTPAPQWTGPQALMTTILGVIDAAGLGDGVQQSEIEAGGKPYEPCDLLLTDSDRAAGASLVPADTVWSASIEMDPVSTFQTAGGPRTVLDVRVIRLADAAAAAAAAAAVRAAPCPGGEFPLNNGLATARWQSRTVTVDATKARLTTATVNRVNPETGARVYLPGDARLAFAHGPLLISVEALALRSRGSNSGTEITAVAQKTATSLASAIAKIVPTSPED